MYLESSVAICANGLGSLNHIERFDLTQVTKYLVFAVQLFSLFPSQVLQDCMRHHGSIVEIGKLWVSVYITAAFTTYFTTLYVRPTP